MGKYFASSNLVIIFLCRYNH